MLRWVSQFKNKERDVIFNDAQNIHDSHIILTARESVNRLIDLKVYDSEVIKKIINDPDLKPDCIQKLVDYVIDPSIHSALSVTFLDVLSMVYPLILQLPEPFEGKKILENEMETAECKCFTGKIVRLLNVLNGLHPAVCIQISEASDLSNIIINLIDKHQALPVDALKALITKELLERGYSEEKISEWTDHL